MPPSTRAPAKVPGVRRQPLRFLAILSPEGGNDDSSLAAHVGPVRVLLALGTSQALAVASTTARVAVYFSPQGGATDAVVQAIGAAQTQILVQAYAFTSAPIATALVEAHKRSVNILAVLDKSNQTQQYSAATFLLNAGIPTRIDAEHAIAHSKVMVIDNATLIRKFQLQQGCRGEQRREPPGRPKRLSWCRPIPPTSRRTRRTPSRTAGKPGRPLLLPLRLGAYGATAIAKCIGCPTVSDTQR